MNLLLLTGLKLVLKQLIISGIIILPVATPSAADIYQVPNRSYLKPKPYAQALTEQFQRDFGSNSQSSLVTTNDNTSSTSPPLDSTPLKANLINKEFFSASKTFNLDQLMQNSSY